MALAHGLRRAAALLEQPGAGEIAQGPAPSARSHA
jgi:hypothetical protein